jgi:hypothetical protein
MSSQDNITIYKDIHQIDNCSIECHGPSEVRDIRFTHGLFEDNTYMRIHSVMPTVEKGESVCCVCAKESNSSSRIEKEKSFCCNRHYLEWWARRYLE